MAEKPSDETPERGLEGSGRSRRKRPEENDPASQRREDRMNLFQAIGHPVLILKPDHTILAANRAAIETLGGREEAVLGRKCHDLFHGTDRPPDQCPMEKMRHSGIVETESMEVEAMNGTYLVSCTPVFDDAGLLGRVIHVATDVTERKRTEKELESERDRAQIYLDVAGVIFLSLDIEGRVTLINKKGCEILGYEEEEIIGKNWFEAFIPPDDRAVTIGVFDQLMKGSIEPVEYYENRILVKDGKERMIAWHNTILRNGRGEIEGTFSSGLDITDRVQAEEDLRKREETLRSIFRAAPIGIGVVVDRVLVQVNDRLCEMLDRGRDELVGQSARVLYATKEEYDRVGQVKYEQIRRQGIGTVETCFRKKSGSVFDVLISSVPLDPRDISAGVTFTAMDITEQKHAEAALRENEERYRAIFEQVRDVIYVTSQDGDLIDINPAGWHTLLYSKEEFQKINVSEHYADPEERAVVSEELERQGFIKDREITFRRKDGTEITCLDSATLWRDQTGRIRGYIGTLRDITAHKKAEREKRKLEQQLRQSQKMEAIGTLASGIAHDFNNILSSIIGYAELSMLDVEPNTKLHRNFQEILRAGDRATELVRQILTFTRQAEQDTRPVNVHLITKEALRLLRSALPTTIDIRPMYGDHIRMVTGDPTQIHQVVMNLCTNAAHAMRISGGVLEVKLKNADLDDGNFSGERDLMPGAYVKLTVSDTGHGMKPEILERIFDPYFTTKEVGEGTGMGLAVVHGIVKNYGGTITVESEPGEGTVFEVFLPGIEHRVKEEASVRRGIAGGKERILLIDDEKAIVDVTQQMLSKIGYHVVAKTSPMEALALFREQPDAFDLVMTDMTMPLLTGDLLTKEIMAIRGDIPVILCTGFSERINKERAAEVGIRAFVMKPVVLHDLAETIRNVLDAG